MAPQPVNTETIIRHQLAAAGVPAERLQELERRIVMKTGIDFASRDAREWAKAVCVPTLLYQVRDDVLTEASDMQLMFDNLPVTDKKLVWVEGTTRRWDGYTYFQRHPEEMLDWFSSHMA